jgi:UPF0716 family protein affecting phage T7 exclusion
VRASLIWLLKFTTAISELLVAVAIGAAFGAAITIRLIYMGSYGGIR